MHIWTLLSFWLAMALAPQEKNWIWTVEAHWIEQSIFVVKGD
jgi:hypothetical protein